MSAILFNGDGDAPPPLGPLVTAPPAFRPQTPAQTIDDLYGDVRIPCRRCGLRVLDGKHAGWGSHPFEPYPIDPKSFQEVMA